MRSTQSRRKPFLIFIFTLSFAAGGVISGMLMTSTVIAASKDRYQDLQLFTKVLNLVEQHYVDEVDTRKLIYGGIKGMLASLDPHTNFLPPEIFSEFKEETTGEFGGVGIEIGMQDDVLTVVSPIEDTPAWKAGIKSGDKIVEIEGHSTKGMSLAEAVSKMRGKNGTPASLTIWRESFDKPRKFTMMRELIKVKSVKYTDLEDGGYAYARITSFIEHTGKELKEVLDKHMKKYGTIKGLVLDLRNNPGGLLDQAVGVADEFIEEGPIVSTIGRNRNEKVVEYAKKEGTRTGFPIIVLVNEYSASASEIVAGALQDSKRALIMGTRSFGKGSVQSVVELGDGAGLKLTVARYYTPAGRSIQGLGITPDIKLENVDAEAFQKAIIQKHAMREADIEGHLIGENEEPKEAPRATEREDDSDTPFYKLVKVNKKSGETETPEERELRIRAEDSKLSPRERLLKRDYQALQAFNYIKSWSQFRRLVTPQEIQAAVSESQKSPTVKKAQAVPAPSADDGSEDENDTEVATPLQKPSGAKKSTKAKGATPTKKPSGNPGAAKSSSAKPNGATPAKKSSPAKPKAEATPNAKLPDKLPAKKAQ